MSDMLHFTVEGAKINLVSDENNFRLHYDPQIVEVMRHPETFSDMNYWNEYSRVACPTLVLHGEHSDMLSNEAAQEMTRHGPRPRIITFSGCGHAPALINPEQIGAVAGFLNS